jgi:hypothetical protein
MNMIVSEDEKQKARDVKKVEDFECERCGIEYNSNKHINEQFILVSLGGVFSLVCPKCNGID